MAPQVLAHPGTRPFEERRRAMMRDMEEMQRMLRLVEACKNIATELERLRLLKEHELGVRVEHEDGDPYVKVGEK
jgi:hypothetical protein